MGAAASPAASPPGRRQEPCQREFDAYVRCCQAHQGTRDMTDCEDITANFQQCMRLAAGGSTAAPPPPEAPPGLLQPGQVMSQHSGPRSLGSVQR
mmetsp:Transcript_4298/g.13788  ORF Transcript_4298/g.13788 Transcript_4298/m.13788 type:complete len:95 (-) Transcript_4298:198-482(-)